MSTHFYALTTTLIVLLVSPHNNAAARLVLRPANDRTQAAAQSAIAASLASAHKTSAMISSLVKANKLKPREAAAVSDCIVNVGDSVEELRRSLTAMGKIIKNGGKEKIMEVVLDVEAWVSAALTDESTCMDGLAEAAVNGEVERVIRGQSVKVAQLIKNALAIVCTLHG